MALTYIIEFMYCGIVEVPKKKLEDILHVAKILQVKGLYNSSSHWDMNPSSPMSTLISDQEKDESTLHDINLVDAGNEDEPISQSHTEQESRHPPALSGDFSTNSTAAKREQKGDAKLGKASTIILSSSSSLENDSEKRTGNYANMVSRHRSQ